MAREDRSGSPQLVAYVVRADPETALELPVIRSYLAERLPAYMLPQALVLLAALPLLPHGKLDRAALPPPERSRGEQQQAAVLPRSATETVLAGIWCEVLALDTVGIHDNFFELGGHSLLATQVVARVRERLQIALPLRTLFASPTIAAIAEALELLEPAEGQVERTAGAVQRVKSMSRQEIEAALRDRKTQSSVS